jgi:hypothetical protein
LVGQHGPGLERSRLEKEWIPFDQETYWALAIREFTGYSLSDR